jgi:hypothetical protein
MIRTSISEGEPAGRPGGPGVAVFSM